MRSIIVNWGRRLIFSIALLSITFAGCGAPSSSTTSNTATGVGSTSTGSVVAQVIPAYLTFGDQVLNSSSSPATITFTNTGNESVAVSSISVSGNFTQTNDCGTAVGPSAACTVKVVFKPAALGSQTGAISFVDNAALSPQVVTLSGSGVAEGQLADSPTSISFGNVLVGHSTSQGVTISNVGGQNVTILSVGTSGAGIGATGISTPITLSLNQSTTFNVTFNPTSTGVVSGSVYLANDGASPVTIPITGVGSASSAHEVLLSWDSSASPVAGYNVYRSNATGGPYTKLTTSAVSQTSYTDLGVVAGASYYYVVTAVGSNNQESSYSAEAKACVPTS